MPCFREQILSVCLTAVSAALVFAAGFIWLTRSSTPTAAARSLAVPLTVDPEELDAGEVWEHSEYEHRFRAHNRSGQPVSIHGLSASCECTALEPRQFEVPAGGAQLVTATIDLTHRSWDAGVDTVPFSVVLEPRMGEGPIVPMAWNIHGTVRRNPISVSTSYIDLDDRSLTADPREGREVSIDVLEKASSIALTAEMIPADAGVAVLERVAPDRYLLRTGPAPDLGPGRFEYRVVIRAEGDALQEAGPSRTITVTGTIPHDISAQPRMITFGARPQGSRESDVVLISSETGRAFTIESVEASGAGTSVKPITGDRFGENIAAFEIQQEYVGTGHVRGSVRFDVRYADGEREVVESVVVRVSHYALANREVNGGGER